VHPSARLQPRRQPVGVISQAQCQGQHLELKRLVATSLSQHVEIDYTELYVPVVKYSTFRVSHAMVAGLGLAHRVYDTQSAFL
jgi:hypothetical protein